VIFLRAAHEECECETREGPQVHVFACAFVRSVPVFAVVGGKSGAPPCTCVSWVRVGEHTIDGDVRGRRRERARAGGSVSKRGGACARTHTSVWTHRRGDIGKARSRSNEGGNDARRPSYTHVLSRAYGSRRTRCDEGDDADDWGGTRSMYIAIDSVRIYELQS
jgi:hypothetical protein